MKIKLLTDIPLSDRHGLVEGLIIDAEEWPARKPGHAWWRVIAPKSKERVGILRREAVVIEE
jgi:hypothetical protein